MSIRLRRLSAVVVISLDHHPEAWSGNQRPAASWRVRRKSAAFFRVEAISAFAWSATMPHRPSAVIVVANEPPCVSESPPSERCSAVMALKAVARERGSNVVSLRLSSPPMSA